MRFLHLKEVLGVLMAGAAVAAASADTATFYFAPVGQSYLAILGPDDALVGQQVVNARVYLTVEAFPGSDAANFFTDIAFPIEPFKGNDNALAIFGEDLNWSGSGIFNYFEETDRFNGVFIATRFGAETPAEDFAGEILEGSRIEFDYIPIPEPGSISLLGAVGLLLRRR